MAENPGKTSENQQKGGEIVVLLPKRERFCQEYVKDHNGTQAAIRAGYSEKTANEQASRLLADAKLKLRIAQLDKTIAERLGIDAQWVLQESIRLYKRCMQEIPVMRFDYSEKQLIQEKDVETGQGIFAFDSRGANAALDRISKYTGGFTDRHDHTTKGKELPSAPIFQVVNTETQKACERIIAGEGREALSEMLNGNENH